ncbi:hypothetical protein CDL15_Pgr018428 [Punica granatum]|uniref:Uncharacterized protein n=1 Tax=Punica granatum TaxID=22663 RepID=A0A218WZC3_PUNGR|nr:hypothetical protein CDL15_Pgr018428 [Punica granatum]
MSNRVSSLSKSIGSIRDSFRKTTTTATSRGELAVGSRWPCSKIPSGTSVATSDPTGARRVRISRRTLAVRVDPITLGPNDHHSHLRGSVRSQEPLTLPQNSIGSLRGDVRPDWCQTGPNFQTYSVFRDLCRAVRVDPITLGPNDHHSHLRGSVRSQEPLTLPQNSIGSLRGDVRPDWCQTGPNFQTYSVFRDLCRAVRVDPITLGPNDHHSHLRGSVRSQEPLTLPQNSIGSLRGDVRPDWCRRVRILRLVRVA